MGTFKQQPCNWVSTGAEIKRKCVQILPQGYRQYHTVYAKHKTALKQSSYESSPNTAHSRYSRRTLVMWLSNIFLYIVAFGCLTPCVHGRVIQTSTCKSWVDGRIINLEPLQRLDGKPRFEVSYGSSNFSFNPCASFNMPQDPHSGAGDQCNYVALCKSKQKSTQTGTNQRSSREEAITEFYTIGIQSSVHMYSRQLGASALPPEVKDRYETSAESGPIADPTSIQIDLPGNIKALADSSEETNQEDVVYEGDASGPGVEVKSTENIDEEFQPQYIIGNGEDKLLEDEEGSGAGGLYGDTVLSNESSYSSSEEMKIIYVTFRGVRSMKSVKSYIHLFCDHVRKLPENALFEYVHTPASHDFHFILRHQCACPDGCPDFGSIDPRDFMNSARVHNDSEETDNKPPDGSQHMWIVLLINGGIFLAAIIIGGVFCRKGGGNGAYYNMLPALHSSRLTMASTESLFVSRSRLHKPEFLEYTSALTKAAQPPTIDGGIIEHKDLDVGQRLGGGLFGDTYIAELHERKTAAKRINVGVHQNQVTEDDLDWIHREVLTLSKQNHKNLVSVLGFCRDSPQPYVVLEYITGGTLKDLLRKEETTQQPLLPWTKRIKMCLQISDAMAYLHSASPPILHRDLRCSNVIIEEEVRVKVSDYGLTRIMQRLRSKCTGHRSCYCKKSMSAVPSSVRWTPPEILHNPTADELHSSSIVTPSCDVYSMAMVMWEVASSFDPFEDIPDEEEVIEIVKGGGRPPMDSLSDVHPLYAELTKKSWSQKPENRPTFKVISAQLKRTLQGVTKEMAASGKRNHTTSTTLYIQSLLNTNTAE